MSNTDALVSFEDDITITLTMLTGKSVQLTCQRNTTLKTIKQWLQDREGIPVSMGIFIYSGARLEDDDTLEKYDVQNNDVISVVLKCRGD